MKIVPRGGRRSLAIIVAAGLVAGTLTIYGAASAGAEEPEVPPAAADDTLGAHDLKLLAEAEANGEQSVTLIVATDKGAAADVAAQLRNLGATVANQVDEVGYVRAQVPIGAVTRAAKLPGVAAVDLNETIQLPDPRPETMPGTKSNSQAPITGPGPDTPAANPHLPTHETGAVLFKKLHPTWDGRGVTIGILDSGIDLDNPALQTTSTGERKIIDWITATDPIFDGDLTWRLMLTQVTGPTFTIAGTPGTWTAPAAGAFRFNRFNEVITAASSPGGNVNRDGDTTDRFGVLYDLATNNIWVDSNQNQDFTDEPMMRPYKENFQVGHFGVDNPATAVRDQMPFVVEFREDVDTSPLGLPGLNDFVNIGIIESEHGSHVAGITSANDILGNPNLDGAAPGAKIVSSRACSWGGGCTAAALTDGMIELVVNRGVNVVNMSIGGLPALNDGNNARAILYNTLIRDFGVQLFISAGNSGPGANTIGDPSVATDVVSAGANISKDTWLANYGSVVETKNTMFNFSSRGPREDGGFKPNISAPGSAISTTPLWQPGLPVPEAGYALPPGLQMLNGTSMAAPQATGAAALLLSAAAATGKNASPPNLRRAIYSSANWINNVPAYMQGNGMFDVNGAWALLWLGVQARKYTVDAPVCTPISDFLEVPDRGTGIYNRCAASEGGHQPGQSKTYTVKITRTTGPTWSVLHRLRWVGNDGTFKSPSLVLLPLNQTVNVSVEAKPGPGLHSAIMEVDDLATLITDFEVMNVVVAANTPNQPAYSFATAGSVHRNAFKSFFVTVPAGAAALQVNLSDIAAGSQTRFIAINPHGIPVESTSSLVCYTNFSNPATCNPDERSYENPLAGIWEIEVESRRTSSLLANPFALQARIQGVSVDPAIIELASVTSGTPSPLSWTLTNTYGPVVVSGQGGPLGSSARSRPTIAHLAQQFYTVTVPAGASRLTVTIGNPSDLGADLDLFVDGPDGSSRQSADGDSEESVTVLNPAPGVWDILVDGFSVPAGTTEYDYLDVFFSGALGSVSVTPTAISLANGASASLTGSVTALDVPPAGRQLFGELVVVTDEGAVVGRGGVAIGAVT